MKKILAILVLLGAVLAFTSCNTMSGAGKDIQDAGQAVEKAAK